MDRTAIWLAPCETHATMPEKDQEAAGAAMGLDAVSNRGPGFNITVLI